MRRLAFSFLILAGLGVQPLVHAAAGIGQPAPDFTLQASDGKTYTLSQLRGKTVVLAWFPKAFTGG